MGFKARTQNTPPGFDGSLHMGVLAVFRFEKRCHESGSYTKPIETPFKSAIRVRLGRGDSQTIASLLSQADVCLDHPYLVGGYSTALELLQHAYEVNAGHFEVQYLLSWTLEQVAIEKQDIEIAKTMKAPIAALIQSCDASISKTHKRALAFAYYSMASLLLHDAEDERVVDKALALGRKAHSIRDDAKFLERIEVRCRGRRALLRGISGELHAFDELAQELKNFAASPLGPEVAHPAFVAYLRDSGPKKVSAYVDAYESRGVLERAALARTQLAKGAKLKDSDLNHFIKLGDIAGLALMLSEFEIKLSAKDKEKCLVTSVSQGTVETTQFLINKGFSLEQELMNCVSRVDVAQYLLSIGLQANAAALIRSVRGGYSEVMHFLLSLGVDPEAKHQGKSAVDTARECGNKELLESLGSSARPAAMDFDFIYDALKTHSSFYESHPLGDKGIIVQVAHLVEVAELTGVASLNELVQFLFEQGQHDVAWVFAHAAAMHLGPGKLHKKLPKEAAFIIGNVELKGNLNFSHPIIIAGNLLVSGGIVDGEPDSMLIVSGSVGARNIVSDGSFFVAGDIDVEDFIFGHYNHGTLAAGGRVKARAVVMDDHDFRCNKKPETKIYVTDAHSLADKERKVLSNAFGTACFSDDSLDAGFFIDRALQPPA